MDYNEIVIPVLTFLLGSLLAYIVRSVPKGALRVFRRKFFIKDRWIRGPKSDIRILEWEELPGAWFYRGSPSRAWKLLLENSGPHHIAIHRCRIMGAIYTKRSFRQRSRARYLNLRHPRFSALMLRIRIHSLRVRQRQIDHSGLVLSSYAPTEGKSSSRLSTATIEGLVLPAQSSVTVNIQFAEYFTGTIESGDRPRIARFMLSISDWDVISQAQSSSPMTIVQVRISRV